MTRLEHPEPIYRVETNSRYAGIPLIEALPDVPSWEEAYAALHVAPASRPADFRSFSAERKLDLIAELQHIFLPTAQHIQALQQIVAVIRECYAYRDFNRPEVQAILHRALDDEHVGLSRLSETGGGSNGILLWGVTGSGKTSFIDRLQSYLYSVQMAGRNIARGPIYHRIVQGRSAMWPQLVMVRMQCQSTLNGTIEELFALLDNELGTDISSRIGTIKTRDKSVRWVKRVLSIHFVGILVVEDTHKLKDSGLVVLEYFCDLMEDAGFPVLTVGTYKYRALLGADPSVASKLSGKGKLDFKPLPLLDEAINSVSATFESVNEDEIESFDEDEWTPFVEELWALNVFSVPTAMPKELPRWLHFQTCGIRRIARIAMAAIFTRSVYEDGLKVDEALLDDIAQNELAEYQVGLQVLRKRNSGLHISDAEATRWEHYMLPIDGEIARATGAKLRKEIESENNRIRAAAAKAAKAAVRKGQGAPKGGTTRAAGAAKPPKPAKRGRPRKRPDAQQPKPASDVYDGLPKLGG